MRHLATYLTLAVLVAFTSCGTSTQEPTDTTQPVTKDEARTMAGKGDHTDWCEVFDWYGDGICDDFCTNPDPDCAVSCSSDADCADGYCDLATATVCAGLDCPDPQCVDAECDDGSTLSQFCDIRELCGDGEVSAVIGGCFQCVDARTCEAPAPSCDDGTTNHPLCDIVPACENGTVVAVQNSCFVCVDPVTCQEPTPSCDDGSAVHPLCDQVPSCDAGTVAAVSNGCFQCVDPVTCEVPDATGQMCGGIAGFLCPDGFRCAMPAGMCNVADGAGSCVRQADACAQVFDPVCGCDGNTYSNACMAGLSGMSIDHDGECPSSGGNSCGSRGLPPCGADEYCAFEASAICGATDIPGTCATRPQACITLFDPVCGCDGNTYSNGCFAASAGVSVASDGSCP